MNTHTHVLTLIAANRLPEIAVAAQKTLSEIGAKMAEPEWLASGISCDIGFAGAEPTRAEAALRERLAGAPIDLAVQPSAGRRKRLLLADMESTIITRELIDELAALAGLGETVAAITMRSMRGEVDFARSLRERVAMLAGQPEALLARVEALIEPMPGARTLVRTMGAHGARTALVSGGFDRFAAIVAADCGFDEFHANRLEIAEGKLTGKVAGPILDRAGKRAVLRRIAADLALPLRATAAIGDGANDIAMLQSAGLGVAFRAKPALAAVAKFRLDHGDLTGLLYLQGYRSEEFKE
jgi:phosphoserine phosphatase